MKAIALCAIMLGLILVTTSIGFHLISCICVNGDDECDNRCHIRFVVANYVGLSGLGLSAIGGGILGMIYYKRGKKE